MPRRYAPGEYIFHVMNRAIAGTQLFARPEDYQAFEGIMAEACLRVPMRLLAYCLMPNHWHMMLWPVEAGDLSRHMHWLTMTHARRWRQYRDSPGRGHVYQGPFKAFPIEMASGVICVGRYIERNALTANLVQRAEEWRFGSLWRRTHPHISDGVPPLFEWPVVRPTDWITLVNEPQTKKEIDAIRLSVARCRPFGPPEWQERVAAELKIESSLRVRGRPPKKTPGVII